MSTKSTALLLAVAAALFAFLYFVERPIRLAALVPPNRKVLADLDPARVRAVEIQVASGEVIDAEQTNSSWQLTKPVSYPANAALIGKLLDQLAKWEWHITIGPDELAKIPNAEESYGFVTPQFTIVLHEVGQDQTLEVGRSSALGDEVYLKMRGGFQIYIAGAELLKWIPSDPDQWRDLAVLDLKRAAFQRIEVSSVNDPRTFELDPVSRLWGIIKPFKARANTEKINALLGQLEALQVRRFVPDDSPELEASGVQGPAQPPQLKLTFMRDATGTNTPFAITLGASPVGDATLVYARRLSPPGVVEISKAALIPWEGGYTNFLDLHLTSLPPSLITSIYVNGIDEFTARKAGDGAWEIIDGNETFPADKLLMKEWLEAFTNLPVDIEQMTVADVAGYGLDAPFLRYRLSYTNTGGPSNSTLTELRFGADAGRTGKVFEQFTGYESVNSINPAQFAQLPQAGWELRDRSIFHFESNEVTGIAVHHLGGERRFVRDKDNQWVVAAGSSGSVTPEALTTLGINETLYRMGRLQAVYWSGENHQDQFGFGPADYRISFELNRSGRTETNTIYFGGASPYLHPYAYVIRDGQPLNFEFPIDLYENWVTQYLDIPPAYRPQK